MEQFARSELLLGEKNMEKLKNSRVAVFGIGGVGGFTAEALARTGVGALELFDMDTVSITNFNRQIIATLDTVGKYKTDVMKERIAKINPEAEVVSHRCFFLPDNSAEFDFSKYDYVVD
ncbi:MAG: ThiF family adenylyltransferase, partial [Oscillospiraceae bacterium]|nr:ThiF family adenylyltransferase [Oscillospiraceae bacterium]